MNKPVIMTVDAAVLVDRDEIVLIKRNIPPDEDKLCLPGGHVDYEDDNLYTAAIRELLEETSITTPPAGQFLMLLDAKDRDKRDDARRISAVFLFHLTLRDIVGMHASSDAKAVVLKKLSELKPEDMGFDHFKVIQKIKESRRPQHYIEY